MLTTDHGERSMSGSSRVTDLAQSVVQRSCLLCRKRRVRCDLEQPACRRCRTDQRTCPGYGRQLTWKNYVPIRYGGQGLRASRTDNVNEDPSTDLTIGAFTTSKSGSIRMRIAPSIISPEHRQAQQAAQAVDYFNYIIVPDFVPYPFSNDSSLIDQRAWVRAPPVLHSILIVLVLSHQLMQTNARPSVSAELYKSRGKALYQLGKVLETTSPTKRPFHLAAVLMILQAEIQVSATESWSVHLEAAYRVIEESGGLLKCWNTWPKLRGLLALYIVADAMSATTSPVNCLNLEHFEDLNSDILYLPYLEGRLLTQSCPVPLPILSVIVKVTLLRLRAGSLNGGRSSTELPDLWDKLRNFDAHSWSERILSELVESPYHNERHIAKYKDFETSEWAALGECYRCATAIYLARTLLNVDSTERVPGQALDIRNSLNSDVEILRDHLDGLVRQYQPGRHLTARPGLWRFSLWPMFMYALEVSAWKQVEDAEAALQMPLCLMQAIGTSLGAKSMHSAADLLEALRRKRSGSDKLTYDGCFDQRCLFAL